MTIYRLKAIENNQPELSQDFTGIDISMIQEALYHYQEMVEDSHELNVIGNILNKIGEVI